MKPLRKFFDRIAPYFEKGGKLERLYPIYEVIDSFFYTSDEVTTGTCRVRDALEFKRMMSTVMFALLPCIVMGMYNTGLQANRAMAEFGVSQVPGWRGTLLEWMHTPYDPANVWANVVHAAVYL